MTLVERINRTPLSPKTLRRCSLDAQAVARRGARRMLEKALNEHRQELLEANELRGWRSPSVATWMAKA